MEAEIRFHVDAFTEDLIRQGVLRPEAYRRARIEFGAIENTKEECRDARGISFTEASPPIFATAHACCRSHQASLP
jgi:hypothetical protein